MRCRAPKLFQILRLAQQHDKGLTRCTEMRSRPISFRCMPPAQDKKCQWKLHAAAPIATRTSSNVPTADSLSGKRLVLIDGHALLFRFHFAYGGVLSTSKGQNTSIAYGFLKQILRLLLEVDPPPTHMAIVFDAKGKNFRHELFPGYKEQRPPMPGEIKEAIPQILEVLDLLKMPVLRIHGVEADDVIGTLATRYANQGAGVMIVSSDKDFYQLLCDRIQLLRAVRPTKSSEEQHAAEYWAGLKLYNANAFENEFGIQPSQWRDVRALWGDKSDNIPGIAGIGDKGALALIKEHGSIKQLLEQASQLKRKLHRERLSSEEGQNSALLGLELVTIQTNMDLPPLRLPFSDYEIKELSMTEKNKVLHKLEELEFRNLLDTLQKAWAASQKESRP